MQEFKIRMKNHCDRDTFEHKPETILKYISITVIFLRYFEPCMQMVEFSHSDDNGIVSILHQVRLLGQTAGSDRRLGYWCSQAFHFAFSTKECEQG